MDNVSSISTEQLLEKFYKMKNWSKPTYQQMMEYMRIYSELEIRNAL